MSAQSRPGPDLTAIAKVFDPSRLTQARRLARLSKADLHRRVGVSPAAIGQYERGEVRPRAETVAALARALDVPPGFFALGRPKETVEIAEITFRRLRSTSVAQQHQAAAFIEQVWELSRYLEQHVVFPELDLPDWALGDGSRPDPVSAARALRSYWGLGSDPISHLVYQLELHGILAVFFSMKQDALAPEVHRIDAFSTNALTRPVVVLTPDKADDVMRHRFTAAHELGHIVLHRGRLGHDTQVERQADAFAAEFLSPRDRLVDELPRRLSFARLSELSDRWGVSVKSLVYRCKELELISESTARRAYVTLNSIPAGAQPVRDYPGERPELLRNAIGLLEEHGTSLFEIAEALEMTPRRVRQLADIEDLRPRLTLVQP